MTKTIRQLVIIKRRLHIQKTINKHFISRVAEETRSRISHLFFGNDSCYGEIYNTVDYLWIKGIAKHI